VKVGWTTLFPGMVTAWRRLGRFLGTAVTVRQHGANGGDSQADGAVPGHGSDDDGGGGD
jgi:hypothetical protein